MLKKIQKYFIKKNIEANLSNRNKSNINDSLSKIGFLVEEDLNLTIETFLTISKELGLQPKDVQVFIFKEVKDKIPSLQQNIINNRHFSWNGKINNQNANEFLEANFDVLIAYYNTKNEYLDLMTSKSKAKFKVGFTGIDNRLFDLIINVQPNNYNQVTSELVKYFKILNKIN